MIFHGWQKLANKINKNDSVVNKDEMKELSGQQNDIKITYNVEHWLQGERCREEKM